MNNNKEFKNISDILTFSKGIETIYKKLAELEKEGKLDSEEYDKTHELISSCIELENKKYKKIENFLSDDIDEIRDLIEYINDTNEDDYESVTNITNYNKHKRLYNRLRDFTFLRNEEELLSLEESETNENEQRTVVNINGINYLLNLGKLNKLDLMQEFRESETNEEDYNYANENREVIMSMQFNKYGCINAYFMKYLLEEIEKCTNKKIKDKLIDYKYELIYSTFTLEASFAVNKKNFANPRAYELLIEFGEKLNPNEYEQAYSGELAYEISEMIGDVVSANYNEKDADEDEKVSNIVKTLYGKAMLAALNNENQLSDLIKYYNVAKTETYATKDDLKNIDTIFNQDKIHKLTKKVD